MKNFVIIILLTASVLFANEIVVTNTNDSGAGSLRQAIYQANATPFDPDSIVFHIPKSDPNYVDSLGVWVIRPDSALPAITGEGTIIDGRSQSAYIGSDTNPIGPEIVLDGINAGTGNVAGLNVKGNGTRIWGLVIHNFVYPNIWIQSNGCNVAGCYLGTDATGSKAAENYANSWTGILIQFGHENFIGPMDSTFLPNVISGNSDAEILVSNSATRNAIVNNVIGLGADLKSRIGYYSNGIRIQQSADSNAVFDNIIGGNNEGIHLMHGIKDNEIANNLIGTDPLWKENWGNNGNGIRFYDDATNNFISENIIGKNGQYGIDIRGTDCTKNLLTRNRISENSLAGIRNMTNLIAAPIITQVTATSVLGTAAPNARVEIYSDPEDEGRFFEGETVADASGNFTWNGTARGPNVTAIAIDSNGNTSPFSSSLPTTVPGRMSSTPLKYELFQNYPNPFNPGTTIRFTLAHDAMVRLVVYDVLGRQVETLISRFMKAGQHSFKFDAGNLPAGIYFYELSADDFNMVRKMLLLQ